MYQLLRPSVVFRRIKIVMTTALVVASLVTIDRASAQLTAQALLEPLVEKYGPQYQDVERALESLKENKLDEAKQFLKSAYEKNPDLPPPEVLYAQILFGLGQNEAGRLALEEATRMTPSDPAAYVYLGELALSQRRLAEAELNFKKGMELCQKYSANNKRKAQLLASAYGGLALMEESRENWAPARAHLEELLKYDKDNAVAMTRLGRVIFKMAKDTKGENEAYKLFQKIQQIDPTAAIAEVNMALLYEQDNRRANAEKLMAIAIERDGDNVMTRLAVGKWALDAGKLDLAEANVEAAAKIEPGSFQVLLFKGLVARFKNDLSAAETALKEAHLRSPKHLGAMSQLVLTLIEMEDKVKQQQALDFAEVCVRIYSNLNQAAGREAATVYAWCLSRLNRPEEAFQVIRQVVSKGGISADSAYFAAQILFDAGQSSIAKKMLESALQGERSFPNRKAAEELLVRINKSIP
jgi:tetratricopeptide (TPR) repeat protein